jgi:hypothetical protein
MVLSFQFSVQDLRVQMFTGLKVPGNGFLPSGKDGRMGQARIFIIIMPCINKNANRLASLREGREEGF